MCQVLKQARRVEGYFLKEFSSTCFVYGFMRYIISQTSQGIQVPGLADLILFGTYFDHLVEG
jgi:hypothetical protein